MGRWALTFGYFIPGVRHLTAYVAGATEVELPAFAFFAYVGAFIWSLTFISAGYLVGEEAGAISNIIHRVSLNVGLVAISVLIVFIALRKYRRL